jgi:predicted transcriptional regulator
MKVKLHIGSPKDMGTRFVSAWNWAKQGKRVDETHLTFLDLESLLAGLTPKRLELLRNLHDHPAPSVAELARSLKRDYKRVHEDVQALSMLGLIIRDHTSVRSSVDEIQASLRL